MFEWIRCLAWRIGRTLYCWARGDWKNDPHTNGEYRLLERVVQGAREDAVLIDVGANVGNWTCQALAIAGRERRQIRIFALEPSSSTCDILRRRLPAGEDVAICNVALSSFEGEASFFSNSVGSGTNSLNANSGSSVEQVQVTTLDEFLRVQAIQHVAMLKIDTEGFDLSVLQGASTTLARGAIDLVQFEYNWRWLLNGASLLGVFNLIQGLPYQFGKLTGKTIEIYDTWHFELDRYFENNYVLVRKGSRHERLTRQMQFNSSNVASIALVKTHRLMHASANLRHGGVCADKSCSGLFD